MKRRSVLLVDDDAHILEVLEMRLTALGFDVTSAPGPDEALRLLAERDERLPVVAERGRDDRLAQLLRLVQERSRSVLESPEVGEPPFRT